MNFVYIATSLDGFIATSSGGIDWLHEVPNPENSDYGYAEFIENIDAIVMGRKSFEKVSSFDTWPYDRKVFVLSSTLMEVPESHANKIEVLSGTPREILSVIHSKGYKDLYVDGGVTIQKFLKFDLIDELIITRIPILLGKGIPLFSSLNESLDFTHTKTQVYNDMLVKSHYVRVRDPV